MDVPSRFFVTHGTATSAVSDLNAFDLALMEADMAEQNLVAVSSVIPDGAVRTEDRRMPRGGITFCVLAQSRGTGLLSAGIAYAYREDGKGGYVAESHLHGDADSVRRDLEAKIAEMARTRGIRLGDPVFEIASVDVPAGEYGCALASLVFTERPCTPLSNAGTAGGRGSPTSPRRPPPARSVRRGTSMMRSG